MHYFIETAHGILVEVVHHRSMVAPVLKEMNQRGQIPKRAYYFEKGKKVYIK